MRVHAPPPAFRLRADLGPCNTDPRMWLKAKQCRQLQYPYHRSQPFDDGTRKIALMCSLAMQSHGRVNCHQTFACGFDWAQIAIDSPSLVFDALRKRTTPGGVVRWARRVGQSPICHCLILQREAAQCSLKARFSDQDRQAGDARIKPKARSCSSWEAASL